MLLTFYQVNGINTTAFDFDFGQIQRNFQLNGTAGWLLWSVDDYARQK